MSGNKAADSRQQTADQASRPAADGVLIIDKPAGWTSHDVVAKVRKLMNTRRVGHTGTLDPFATGVLVVCVNRATRLVQFLTGEDKEYMATVRLGFATDTGDLTGTPTGETKDANHISAEEFEAALKPFRGRILQTPPMYSAKKVGGVKLYEMARRGEEIERQPIEIEIKELELRERERPARQASEEDSIRENEPLDGTSRQAACAPREAITRDFMIRVVSSSGTYIRTLAEDIGKTLNFGAHLVGLRRTRAGRCELSQALTLEELAELAEAGLANQRLISMNEVLAIQSITINPADVAKVIHGNSIRTNQDWPEAKRVSLLDEQGHLIAIAEYDSAARVMQPRVVLTAE